MKYYLKVALLTLVISVVVAEVAGPRFGMPGYIVPYVSELLKGATNQTAAVSDVATLEMSAEETDQTQSTVEAFTPTQALDTCVTAIKQVSLHSDFTQVPPVQVESGPDLFKMVWDKKTPTRTMNADGKDVGLLATCHVNVQNGNIVLFSINGRSLVDSSQGMPDIAGQWSVQRKVSDVDNSTNVTVKLKASAPITHGSESSTPELVLHCGEDKTIVYMNTGIVVGAGTLLVQAKIGDDEGRTRWSISTDRKNIFPDGRYIGLIRLLLKNRAADFSFSPNGGDSVTAQFDLEGLPAAVFPLQEACHWQ